MIGDDLRKLDTTPRALRRFGMVIGTVLAALGLWLWLRQKPVASSLLAAAALLFLLGVLLPRALKWLYLGWMALGMALGHVVSTVLLVLIFFLVVTPIGLLARFMGRDFLNRRLEPEANSYWLPRDRTRPIRKSRYEQQF